MKFNTQRNTWILLLLVLLVFGACKAESPTAPPPSSGNPPPVTGTQPPVTNVELNLSVSSTTPLVDSTVTVTATVTQNGQPVPNGTAVEFFTTVGGFNNTTVQSIVRTTTNGVATVLLSSSTSGPATVRATAGNATRTVNVTFGTRPPVEPPVSTTPSISSVTPSIGSPAGGQTVRITGTNFVGPVRVLFDIGGAVPVEGFVVSSTDTTIDVITPGVNLGAGQQLVADVIVFTRANTANEQRVEVEDLFTFRNEQLQPRFGTASPNSGPVTGGTRVTIFGDGFQAPVQVLFGFAEARVINVDFNQILVEAPASRDTSSNGSGFVTGPIPVTIRNINSQLAVTVADAFRYVSAMDITTFRPITGPSTGGTVVTIDGVGFVAPVDVTIAGVRAQVLEVTGTRIVARTAPVPVPCASISGSIQVTNVVDGQLEIYGDDTDEQSFTYIGIAPFISTITTPPGGAQPGSSIGVTVRDPGVGPFGTADIAFELAGRTLIPSPSNINQGSGTTSFTIAVPTTGFSFPTVACTTGGGLAGTQLGPLDAALVFRNQTTLCQTSGTVTINPPTPNLCLTGPRASVTDPAGGTCAAPGTASLTANGFPTTTQDTITISNAPESAPLTISNVTVTGANASEFTINPTSATNVAAGGNAVFTLNFTPTTAGAKNATVTFTTNSTTSPTITVCVQATAIP